MNNLKFLRQKKEMTQKYLANLAKIDRRKLINAERGMRLKQSDLEKLARVLDVEADTLLREKS